MAIICDTPVRLELRRVSSLTRAEARFQFDSS
jgi:hypothetical protein